MSCLPKPVLRGHVTRFGIKTIVGSLLTGIAGGLLFHFLVGEPRRRAFEEFYKTYDAEAHYEEMVRYGYLQSASKNRG